MELKFKSNINCENCQATVSKVLNKKDNIERWNVDLKHDDRILTVVGDISPEEVSKTVLMAGFKVEKL